MTENFADRDKQQAPKERASRDLVKKLHFTIFISQKEINLTDYWYTSMIVGPIQVQHNLSFYISIKSLTSRRSENLCKKGVK